MSFNWLPHQFQPYLDSIPGYKETSLFKTNKNAKAFCFTWLWMTVLDFTLLPSRRNPSPFCKRERSLCRENKNKQNSLLACVTKGCQGNQTQSSSSRNSWSSLCDSSPVDNIITGINKQTVFSNQTASRHRGPQFRPAKMIQVNLRTWLGADPVAMNRCSVL